MYTQKWKSHFVSLESTNIRLFTETLRVTSLKEIKSIARKLATWDFAFIKKLFIWQQILMQNENSLWFAVSDAGVCPV